ncbi:MAG: hypothetical protein HYV09_38470 [Deltaproteobacteria bacterium]|nr:hypothetical protein [Deltaproteobacteria bacterium]
MSRPGELVGVAIVLGTSAASFAWLASGDRDHQGLLGVAAVEIVMAIVALMSTRHNVWRWLRTWSLFAIAGVVLWLGAKGRHAYRGDMRDENFRLTLVLGARAVLFAIAFVLLGRERVRKRFPSAYEL